jgi:hypothetical protein
LDDSQVCSWVSQLQKPIGGLWPEGHRRRAGKAFGSSAPRGCVKASRKLGSRRAEPGFQWRLTGQRSKLTLGRGHVGLVGGRRLGLAESIPLTWGRENESWWSANRLVRRSSSGIATGGVWSHLIGLVVSRQRWCGSILETLRISGRMVNVAPAGRRGVNRVATQGRKRRKRLFDVVSERFGSPARADAPAEGIRQGHDGPGGESRGLENWESGGCA